MSPGKIFKNSKLKKIISGITGDIVGGVVGTIVAAKIGVARSDCENDSESGLSKLGAAISAIYIGLPPGRLVGASVFVTYSNED